MAGEKSLHEQCSRGGGKHKAKSYFDHVTNLIVLHTRVAGLRRRESQLCAAGNKELI